MENRQIGGCSDILGNIAMFTNGMVAWKFGDTHERQKAGLNRMATGALWNIPNFILARYGGQPVPRQFDRLQHKLAAHLEHAGVPLDAETIKLASEEKRRGWFLKIEDFLYNYPTECNSAFLALASAGMLRSGLIRLKAGEGLAGTGNIAVSALTVAAALAGILIPEKTDAQIAAQGHKGTLWGALQKNPLAYANIVMLAGDMTEGVNSRGEFKTAMALNKNDAFRPYAFLISALSAITMVLFLVGDSLTGFGSKKACGKETDRQTAQHELVEQAARSLAAQPQEAREALIKDAVAYMIRQPELRMVDNDPAKLQQEILAAIEEHGKVTEETHVMSHAARVVPKAALDIKYTQFIDDERLSKTLPSTPGETTR
jgi:hypothetical protein